MKNKISLISRIILLTGLCLVTSIALASFQKNIWLKWQVHQPQSQAIISHQKWQTFLTQCVIINEEGINLVDYPHLTEANLYTLKQYISDMSKININNYNRNEQLAFWINIYNALTIQIVSNYYPVDSVQEVKVSPGLFSVGPWGAPLVTIMGTQLSLDDIQNRIIRAIWNDPRALYAINDATIGAANLSKQAYLGATINTQLNQAARGYINSLRGIQVIEGKLIISKIFDWYMDDFGGSELDVINHISQYANEPLCNLLQPIKSINSYIYNWHINSTIASSL